MIKPIEYIELKQGSLFRILPASQNLRNQFTITSFLYNPNGRISDWLINVFGERAVHMNRTISGRSYTPKELNLDFRNIFKLPVDAIQPVCSFEALGYIMLRSEGPVTKNDLKFKPIVGDGNIYIDGLEWLKNWSCFYRVMTEVWRPGHNVAAEPNFWAVIIYCPSKNEQDCNKLSKYISDKTIKDNSSGEKGIIELYIKNMTITANFHTRPLISFHSNKQVTDSSNYFTNKSNPLVNNMNRTLGYLLNVSNETNYAVCLPIPYSSSDEEKILANGALLVEWINYHVRLGLKVIIYDRDGANENIILNSTYGLSQNLSIPWGSDLFVYHNFTILSLLDSTEGRLAFDNTRRIGFDNHRAHKRQGNDKVLTLTHCRFEAKALYNIDKILVVDFDEFLYCPKGGSTATSQRNYIQKFVRHTEYNGFDQLEMTQTWVGNLTISPRDCMLQKTKSGESIFKCFSSREFQTNHHSKKSFHLGHKCIITGYHNACSEPKERTHDCLCQNLVLDRNVSQNAYYNYIFSFKRFFRLTLTCFFKYYFFSVLTECIVKLFIYLRM